MADDDIAVTVDDSETISVDVSDDSTLSTAATTPEQKPAKTKRVLPDVEQTAVRPEQALAEAQQFAKQQEDARKAAEATAANERAMREDAQRRAQQAQQEAEQLRERADNSELAIIENGIASANRELENQQNEYTRAAEAGEFSKMAVIQTKIAKAAAALDRLEDAKSSFESGARRQQPTEGRVEAAPVQQTSAVDTYLSQFAPAAQSWLRQHMDCLPPNMGGDNAKHAKMMAGHYAAVSQNIALNSTEYFKAIEDHLGSSSGVTSRAAEVQVAETPKPKHIQPSAPVSRDAPTSSGQPRSTREVRLTKDQQEMAKVSFPHLPEAQAYGQYARNLIELEAEGKIGRLTH